jgi:hypothetical protein
LKILIVFQYQLQVIGYIFIDAADNKLKVKTVDSIIEYNNSNIENDNEFPGQGGARWFNR